MAKRKIGEIESVSGNTITFHMMKDTLSNMPVVDGLVYRVGQIGSFVKVIQGFRALFGIVIQSGASLAPENVPLEMLSQYQWMSAVLVGEQVGKNFQRGVTELPISGDSVYLVTAQDMEILYKGYDFDSDLCIGTIASSVSLPAHIDLNKLVLRHSCVLGSTGSGKSNAVGVILRSIMKKKMPSSRVLVVDPHGEYSSMFASDGVIMKVRPDISAGEKALLVPFWALPFSQLISLIDPTITEQRADIIRQEIVERKIQANQAHGYGVLKEHITADTPIPYSIKKLWFDLDNIEHMTFQRDRKTPAALVSVGDPDKLIPNVYPSPGVGNNEPFAGTPRGLGRFCDSLRTKLLDKRYQFLLAPGDYDPQLDGAVKSNLSTLIRELLGNNGKITIMDFSDVPSDIMAVVSGSLIGLVYESLYWGQNLPVGGKKQPLLTVLEEAHNYLSRGDQSLSSRVVRRIAKEGRKYGVGLMLVSQRPTELDETVLSQCGTTICLRMSNSADQAMAKGSIRDDLNSLTKVIPSLRTGEALISGEAVRLPTRVVFPKMDTGSKNIDPNLSLCWSEDASGKDAAAYDSLIDSWQKQSL